MLGLCKWIVGIEGVEVVGAWVVAATLVGLRIIGGREQKSGRVYVRGGVKTRAASIRGKEEIL